MTELLIVIVIIAVAIGIGASAYLRAIPEGEKLVATEYLQSLAGAVQLYQQERRDYPAMRFADIGVAPTASTKVALDNDQQSIEALIYQLQYRSDAGKALSRFPQKVLRQGGTGDTLTEPGLTEARPLYVAYDPWGNPIQYLRPREANPYDPNYALSAGRLNNRVLLISMGPDGVPGNGSDPSNQPTWTDPTDTQTYPNPLQLGQGDDIVVQVGATR
jgi:type II secretory pathway pseudopilin PulG